MKNKITFSSTLLVLWTILASWMSGPATALTNEELDQLIQDTVSASSDLFGASDHNSLVESIEPNTSTEDWFIYDLAALGVHGDYADYRARLGLFIEEQYLAKEELVSATDWQRLALVYRILGQDPTSVEAGGETIDLVARGLWDYPDALSLQGSNALIFALLALKSSSVQSPDPQFSPNSLMSELLEYQKMDGGFGLDDTNEESNVDITAMALSALAAYPELDGVPAATDLAVNYLSSVQLDNGGFRSGQMEESSEASAQVIIGLSALGIDAETDERFARIDGTVVDALMRFRNADGSFTHVLSETSSDRMSTEQALRALTALWWMRQGLGSIYELPDQWSIEQFQLQGSESISNWWPWWIAAFVLVAVAALGAFLVIRRGKPTPAPTP